MPGLERIVADLGSSETFLLDLFQPTPAARPFFRIALRFVRPVRRAGRIGQLLPAPLRPGARPRRLLGIALATVRHRPLPAIAATLATAGIVLLAVGAFQRLPLGPAIAATVLVALVVVPLLVVLAIGGGVALTAREMLRGIAQSGFGMCPGMPQRGSQGRALTEWLYEAIQQAAGLPNDEPLTFRMLADGGLGLEMLTTDLSYARPVRVPFDEQSYLFAPADLAPLFPEAVCEQVFASAGVPAGERASTRTWYLPGLDLPVIVGVRLSLSFPLLLSALRLYLPLDPAATTPAGQPVEPVETWMSDGGLASNFPIHFFDSWLPRYPTFGLDLVGAPGPGDPDPEQPVYMPASPAEQLPPHWARVDGVTAFLRQAKDAMQNWRDNLQSELPGARDRVCQVRLGRGEGGLNLAMDQATIATLMGKGRAAGEEILTRFSWPNHRFTRYLTLMQLLSGNLHALAEPFASFGSELAAGAPEATVFRAGHDAAWCAAAGQATGALVALGAGWGPPPDPVGFESGALPRPEPVMRITPRA
jgi:hypothetical protein